MVLSSKGWQFWPNERFFVFFQEMKHFSQLFCEKFIETPKHRSFFEKLRVLVNSIIFRVFSRNGASFQTFCPKVRQNTETWWFVRIAPRSCQIDEFSSFLAKWGTFLKVFVKTSTKRLNVAVCSKSWEFWPNRWFSCFLTKWGTFCNFLMKISWQRRNMVDCLKSWELWPNRWLFVFYHEMRDILQLFAETFMETPKHGTLFERLTVLAK